MRDVLLGFAASFAVFALSTPAQAQSGAAAGFTGVSTSSSQFTGSASFGGDSDRWRRHDRRRDRGFDGAFYYGDREYQGDTAWRSQSYNDWWHERPNRSYPAWMARNQNCDRQWWSGDSLRC